MLKLAYLYTHSELTPWKENVNEETLSFLLGHTPPHISAEVVHFDGFGPEMRDRLLGFDLVFNLSYGYGLAGQVEVAAWLEDQGIRHTASGKEAMALAQDKGRLPEICRELGLCTPAVHYNALELDPVTLYLAKPRTGSCHRDITIDKGFVLRTTLPRDADLIIQPYITGREFSVAVIPGPGGLGYLSLPPIEIEPEKKGSIFIAGQLMGRTFRNFCPDLRPDQRDQLMDQALALHRYIGLKGMSRTDFRMDERGVFYVLDVNAMPNMDPKRSLLPALCQHHGVGMGDLIRRVVAAQIPEELVVSNAAV